MTAAGMVVKKHGPAQAEGVLYLDHHRTPHDSHLLLSYGSGQAQPPPLGREGPSEMKMFTGNDTSTERKLISTRKLVCIILM